MRFRCNFLLVQRIIIANNNFTFATRPYVKRSTFPTTGGNKIETNTFGMDASRCYADANASGTILLRPHAKQFRRRRRRPGQ